MDQVQKDRNTTIILDGNAILHRAYHALPPLTTKTGAPIGAVYGFFSMLLKLIADIAPLDIIVTFDRPKPTFRQQLFVGYQAKRPRMDDTLSGQIGILHELLTQAGICIFEVDGFEADDVIGTIAEKIQSEDKKMQIIIVSGDRDLFQLINKQVFVLVPLVGITKMALYDEKGVVEKFHVKPEQMIDYKALAGDASDNYSGVPGVGPKSAITLVQKFGSIEEIYRNIDELTQENRKLALKLAENQEQALLAKKLATIITTVPLSFSLKDCSVKYLDKEKLLIGFKRYDIKSLVKRIEDVFPEAAKARKTSINGQLNLLD